MGTADLLWVLLVITLLPASFIILWLMWKFGG